MSFKDKWDKLQTDIASHPIEGFTHTNKWVSIPLITHAYTHESGGELWQGGCVDGVVLPDDFNFVVSLYPWEKYALGPMTNRIEVEAYDSPLQDPEVFEVAALSVAEGVKIGQKVLVHCQAGLNRSGVTATLALERLGFSTEDAIALLREKRSELVLSNVSFETWLTNRKYNEDVL